MALPTVVIVGRPNVGKSSLLNSLARQRISIVDPRSGITRDRVAVPLAHDDCYFELVDTGGIGIVDDDQLEEHVEEQIYFAVNRARLILFMLDIEAGITSLDQAIAVELRRVDVPVIPIANKADAPQHEPLAGEFARLGFGTPLCVSALHGRGREALLERIAEELGPTSELAPEVPVMKLALVGKRNAGKSTLVNTLAGEERMIVSEVPGTTRDAVDVTFEKDRRKFVAIDTAGVRKKSSMDDIDFYSYTRALRSIRRCDVVVFMIDAMVPVAEVDVRLAGAIVEHYKPVVIAVNKWDLARDAAEASEFDEYLAGNFPLIRYAPVVFITAKTGKNADALVDVALSLHKQAHERVSTARLNEALQEILDLRGPSPKRGTKAVKIYYGTQVSVAPPTFVFFCNDPSLVSVNYRRFLENRLRERLPFQEVPMRLWFRPRSGRDSAGG